MTDYKKLVEALRCENTGDDECGSSDCPYWSGLGCMDGQLMEDAAAAIEELEARLGEAENSVERWKDMYLTKHEPKRGEIVRCRECKWYQPDLFSNPWGVCFHEDWVANNTGHTVDEDGFCYRGEREVQE